MKLNPGLLWQKQHSTKEDSFHNQIRFKISGEKLVKRYIWSIVLCGAETGTLLKVDQKYLGSYEMWCWRRMGKTSWNDRVRNDEVLRTDKEEKNVLRQRERRKVNWIGHVLCRNCLIKHIIEES